jgi:1-acyl-sn-glycerol-3-phosphate acyltransferase
METMRRIFSFLSLVVNTVLFSLIALLISPFDRKGETIHRIARFWANLYVRAGGVTVSVEGLHRLPPAPFILMSNHQSALDVFVLLAALPLSYKFVAKRELFLIPFFGWGMKMAGYISIDRDHPRKALKAINEAARRIREGMNILIFPEGTRSRDGNLLPFMKGGFSLALKAGVPVVPLCIVGTAALQPMGRHVPQQAGTVSILVGDPVSLQGKKPTQRGEVMEQVQIAIEGLRSCPTS